MEEVLVLIEENQTWIFVVLSLFALIYVRLSIKRYQEIQKTFFSLERDRARTSFFRSFFMLILVFLGLLSTFIIATFAGPAIPISARPTVMPTVSLLSTPDLGESTNSILLTATPITDLILEGNGCQNLNATLTSPKDGDAVNGVVDVMGAANIPAFAFYKIEIKSLSPDAVWRAISAGTEPVCETCANQEILGKWDTSLTTPGEYAFRLVVMDSAGNAPLPCVISLRVLPSD
ncbi:MAG: hypothetical protein GTO18_11550 [Anaerolineales bacterium]|nr:hypothetical protein [Anaerolineales bacterium]